MTMPRLFRGEWRADQGEPQPLQAHDPPHALNRLRELRELLLCRGMEGSGLSAAECLDAFSHVDDALAGKT